VITVNSKELPWQPGMTVTAVLKAMNYDYPLLAVSVNEHFVARDDYDSFIIDDNAEVKALHICHGG
jgi:thiamine biosynthesis protein ThiS